MNNFKDLGIKPAESGLKGDKMKMARILNREIIVEAFRIAQSKVNTSENCLCIQFMVDNNQHVVFTGSKYLQDQITKVKKDQFPFKATIVKEGERYEFS